MLRLSMALILLLLPLTGCLSRSGPAMPPLLEKRARSQEKGEELSRSCKVRQALLETQQTLYFAQLRDDRPAMATALQSLANHHMTLGEYAVAEERFLQAERRFQRLGDEEAGFQVALGKAILQVVRGRFPEGRAELEALLNRHPRSEAEKEARWRLPLYQGLAMASRGEGFPERALEHLARAETLALQSGSRQELASIRMNRARIFLDQRQWSAARDAAEQAMVLDRESENILGIASDLIVLAAISEQEGLLDEAREQFQQAGDLFEHCGVTGESEASRARADRLAERSGKPFQPGR
ncbi:MAG: hypothetical protein HQM00_08160 [Magnetococcales bacterium]|nr:hypothetical protein [Magnetococcales bacterium]